MTLVEFAEKVSPVPLMAWQKEFFKVYEQAEKENKQLIVCFPSRASRGMVMAIMQLWKMK